MAELRWTNATPDWLVNRSLTLEGLLKLPKRIDQIAAEALHGRMRDAWKAVPGWAQREMRAIL